MMEKPTTPEDVLDFRNRQAAADEVSKAFAEGDVPQKAADAFTDAFQAQFEDSGPTDVAVL